MLFKNNHLVTYMEIEDLIARYGRFDYERASRERGIVYFESELVTAPFTAVGEPYVIFNHTFADEQVKAYFKAHEYGHALLGHTDGGEAHADAFAMAVTGLRDIGALIESASEELLSKDHIIMLMQNETAYEQVLEEVARQRPIHPRYQKHCQTRASHGSYSENGNPCL
ncbi:MAG: hypothetical protein ACQESG_00695 [Nanobdellota archaeon]